jgi:hypothetical protein
MITHTNNKIGVYNSNNPYTQNYNNDELHTDVMHLLNDYLPKLKDECSRMVFQKIEPLLNEGNKNVLLIKNDLLNIKKKYTDQEILNKEKDTNLYHNVKEEIESLKAQLRGFKENLNRNIKLMANQKYNAKSNFNCLVQLNEYMDILINDINFLKFDEDENFTSSIIEELKNVLCEKFQFISENFDFGLGKEEQIISENKILNCLSSLEEINKIIQINKQNMRPYHKEDVQMNSNQIQEGDINMTNMLNMPSMINPNPTIHNSLKNKSRGNSNLIPDYMKKRVKKLF